MSGGAPPPPPPPQPSWRVVATTLAAVTFAISGAWAHDVRTQLKGINEKMELIVRLDERYTDLSKRIESLEKRLSAQR